MALYLSPPNRIMSQFGFNQVPRIIEELMGSVSFSMELILLQNQAQLAHFNALRHVSSTRVYGVSKITSLIIPH